jgi:hypothetical protein
MCDNVAVVLFGELAIALFIFFPLGFLKHKIRGSSKLLKATCCYSLCICVLFFAKILFYNQGLIGCKILTMAVEVCRVAMVSYLAILSDE